jgi:transcriptional regulator with XRE-family HTH domain
MSSRGLGHGHRSTLRLERSKVERDRLRRRLKLAFDSCPDDAVNIAHKLDVCPSNLSKWVRGGALPGLDLLGPLATCLGVSPGWFWSDEPAPSWVIPRPHLVSPEGAP